MATNTNPFYTYSATAGSSKTLQKPQDGGDNNQWGNYINTDLDEIVAAVNALSDKIADANEKTLVDFTATTDAVNHVGITNAAAGNGPTISAAGSESNVDLNVTAKGTGDINLTPGTNGDVNIPASKGITFGDDGEKIEGDGTNLTIASSGEINVNSGTLDLSAQTVDVTLNNAVDALNIDSNTFSIDASNNRVGIGNASPGQKLSIDVNSSNTTVASFDGIEIGNSNTTTSNGAAISFSYGAGGASYAKIGAIHEDRSSGSEDTHLIFTTLGSGSHSEKMRIDSDGDVKVNTGNLVIGTAGKGIDFSVNSHLSGMTSELLDSYEEGTFTSSISGSNITGATWNNLNYTKIGRLVHISGNVTGTIASATTETEAQIILPFAWAKDTFAGSVSLLIGTGNDRFGVGTLAFGGGSTTNSGIYIGANQVNTTGSILWLRFSATYITS